MTDPASESILFLEKVFTRRRHGPVRGVELFNFRLIRDLLALGYRVSVPVHRDWQSAFDDFFGPEGPERLPLPRLGHNALSVPALFIRVKSRTWDHLILANVAKALGPALRGLYKRKQVADGVLIAHREADESFVELVKDLGLRTTAVNEVIADPFRKAGCARTAVQYGIMDSDRYVPGNSPSDKDTVDFCVLGALDNAWKGSDTAIEAFLFLSDELQARCRLHLASFSTPIESPHPSIIVHPWMPAEEIPDLLRSMDIQIVPSRDEEVMRETFSQVMVQGMLTGLPQIVHDLPILTEKLDDGGGLIFKTPAELARHMEILALDADLRKRLGTEAQRTARARYIWNTATWAKQWLPKQIVLS
jgi:glycosyltransferase involved in cell wall biosynthesis